MMKKNITHNIKLEQYKAMKSLNEIFDTFKQYIPLITSKLDDLTMEMQKEMEGKEGKEYIGDNTYVTDDIPG
jgi:hypothetical protein